jgi:glycine cleavage system H lipoate-binding protein
MLSIEQQSDEHGTWDRVFSSLPDSARTCRHEFGLYVNDRLCDNQFNCKDCVIHKNVKCLEVSRMRDGWRAKQCDDEVYGLSLPADRLYHRGHTWIRKEDDGTYTVGLDDFGSRLIGRPEKIDLPEVGSKVVLNEPALTIHTRNAPVNLLAPLSGTVAATGDAETGWFIKIKPERNGGITEHLLHGSEVKKWILNEIGRLQASLSDEQIGISLADGGVLVDELPTAYPTADWDRVYSEIFLQG